MGLLLGLVVRRDAHARRWPSSHSNCARRRYEKMYRSIEVAEWWMDSGAKLVLAKEWVRGLLTVGSLQGAHKAAAGLA